MDALLAQAGWIEQNRGEVNRDKKSLDIFWLHDESLVDSANLPDPHILAAEIADDLSSALGQIEDILIDLEDRIDLNVE
ncbi:MAG: methyltransferase [Deltaproteobacteria bacterium]|nr:MAG: methyltransferase [Deltaproteobacteria bacterium]